MTSTPKTQSNPSSGAATHGVSALASGLDTAYPIRPPARCIAVAPSDGRGVPLAMWIRPSAPSSSAAQPITARMVAELRSG